MWWKVLLNCRIQKKLTDIQFLEDSDLIFLRKRVEYPLSFKAMNTTEQVSLKLCDRAHAHVCMYACIHARKISKIGHDITDLLHC